MLEYQVHRGEIQNATAQQRSPPVAGVSVACTPAVGMKISQRGEGSESGSGLVAGYRTRKGLTDLSEDFIGRLKTVAGIFFETSFDDQGERVR